MKRKEFIRELEKSGCVLHRRGMLWVKSKLGFDIQDRIFEMTVCS
jgi:hypothetical protein